MSDFVLDKAVLSEEEKQEIRFSVQNAFKYHDIDLYNIFSGLTTLSLIVP